LTTKRDVYVAGLNFLLACRFILLVFEVGLSAVEKIVRHYFYDRIKKSQTVDSA